jgi:hypothetical protein
MKPYPARVMNLSKIIHCDSSSINIIYDEGAIGIHEINTAVLANEEVEEQQEDMESHFSQLTSRSRSSKDSNKRNADSSKRNADCNQDFVDLSTDRVKRSIERKNRAKMKRLSANKRRDPVYVVDVHAIPDFDKFFKPCINEKMTLNVKGPLANLHFNIKAIDERSATDETGGYDEIFGEHPASDGLIKSTEYLHRKVTPFINLFYPVPFNLSLYLLFIYIIINIIIIISFIIIIIIIIINYIHIYYYLEYIFLFIYVDSYNYKTFHV